MCVQSGRCKIFFSLLKGVHSSANRIVSLLQWEIMEQVYNAGHFQLSHPQAIKAGPTRASVPPSLHQTHYFPLTPTPVPHSHFALYTLAEIICRFQAVNFLFWPLCDSVTILVPFCRRAKPVKRNVPQLHTSMVLTLYLCTGKLIPRLTFQISLCKLFRKIIN